VSELPRVNPVSYIRRFFDECHAERIGLAATAVWFCLLRHSDSKGESYPSQSMIMKECGLSDEGVRKALRTLIPEYIDVLTLASRVSTAHYRVMLPSSPTQLTPTQLTPTQLTPTQLTPTQLAELPNTVGVKVPIEGTQYSSPSYEVEEYIVATPKKTKAKKKFVFEEVDIELTNRLRDLNRIRNPKWDFAGDIENHYNEMRLLRTQGHQNEKGKIDVARIRAALDWLAQDSFWIPNGNVQSVSKFREKFARFDRQASRDGYSEPTLPLLEANTSAPHVKTFEEEEAERRAKIKEDERARVAAGGKSDRVLFMENRIKTFKMDVAKCWGAWGEECERVWGKDWKDVVAKIAEEGGA